MSIDSTELQTLRDALVRAMASGLRSLMHNGQRMEYQSIADMRDALEVIDGELAGTGASSTRPSAAVASFSRGD